MIIQSSIQCAFSILYMMSSSQTFSKYLSIVSTKLWINSKQAISFSSSKSTPMMKYREAQRRQITLYPRYSMNEHRDSLRERHLRTSSPYRVVRYFTVISLQYFASRVWPCLFTINRNFIILYYKSDAFTAPPLFPIQQVGQFLRGSGLDLIPSFSKIINIWSSFLQSLLSPQNVPILLSVRKFFVSDIENGRQIHKKMSSMDEQTNQNHNVFYNILHPTNKIQCDVCKKDISKHTKILTPDNDYCVGCFSNLQVLPEMYHIINKLDYPLFEGDWTADQELLMFEGLEKHGFGNWSEIAEFMGTSKTREEVEHHYTTVYLESPNFIPDSREILSRRDQQSKKLNKESSNRILKRKARQEQSNPKNQRGYLTVNNQSNSTTKTGTNPAEIIGYMPKRRDFEAEYDNEAELLLAEMEFNDDDTEEEKEMKFNLITIYNHKLTERIRRKEFVITRNLLDLKEQARIEKMRSKEEKEIYNILRVFARFSESADDHQQLVQGIIRQKQIRQRIEQLKQFKKKGFKTLAQVEQQLENKRRKDEKIRRKGEQTGQIFNYDPSKTRRNTKTPTIDRTQKRSSYISRQEDELCKKLNLSNRNYISIKQKIIRECIKQGILERDSASKMFKVDRSTIDSIFDFLVEKEDILCK